MTARLLSVIFLLLLSTSNSLADDKPITSILPIMRAIPRKLNPIANKKWDALQEKEIEDLLAREFSGRNFIFRVKVKSARISVNAIHLQKASEPKYVGVIDYWNPVTPAKPFKITHKISTTGNVRWDYGRHRFYGNENFKSEFTEKIKLNRPVAFKGKIQSIKVSRVNNQIQFKLRLDNLTFSPDLPKD